MGIGGVGLLSTIIAAPVVLGLEVAALGCGLLSAAGKFVSRRLSVKAKKHDEVMILAGSKLNSISAHVSRALTDGQISDEEFRIVVDEVHKYTQMKAAYSERPGRGQGQFHKEIGCTLVFFKRRQHTPYSPPPYSVTL